MALALAHSSAVRQAQAPKKFGLVIVDMLKDVVDVLTYPHSTQSQLHIGFERIGRLISFAAENHIPIIFVVFEGVGLIPIQRLADLAGENAIIVSKKHPNAFSSQEFVGLIERLGINLPIIGGFNRVGCVLETVQNALFRNMPVWTTDEIMFG
ncbi:MAG: isochorismatase family protein, partial [Candidatus Micrarchaeia archaeon]